VMILSMPISHELQNSTAYKRKNIANFLLAFPDKSQNCSGVHLKSILQYSLYTKLLLTVLDELTLHEETAMSKVGKTGQGLQVSRRVSFRTHHPDRTPT